MTSDITVERSTPQRQRGREWASRWLRCDRELVPKRSDWPASLQRVHAYGLLAVVIWFLAVAWWSSVIARRFSLTFDYSFYAQAWYLFAHGHLNPYSSLSLSPYLNNAFELAVLPLAPLWYIWPHAVTLLWAQDAATAGCMALLFLWMCEVVAIGLQRGRLRAWAIALPACGVALLTLSPWPVWIDSFDFHPESLDLLVVLIAMRAFWKGQSRRGWIWTGVALLFGSLGATYIAGFGLSAVIAGRRWRRLGVVLVAAGFVWLVLLSHLGADHATAVYEDLTQGLHIKSVTTNTLLKVMVHHPSRPIHAIWSVRKDIYADVAGGGIIGFFSPWAFGVTLLVLIEGSLTGQAIFIQPYVQNSLPAILLVPLGTTMICIALAASRHRWKRVLAGTLAVLAVANVIGWAHTWTRQAEPHWLTVPTTSAHVLQQTLNRIPAGDEVIVSQGVAGPFAFRRWISVLFSGPQSTFPVHGKTVWFIVAPSVGTEEESTTSADAQVEQLIHRYHARLVTNSYDILVLKWHRPAHRADVVFTNDPLIPAWTADSSIHFQQPTGLLSSWHVTSTSPGTVTFGDYWFLPSGGYTASVRYASLRPVEVQIWDDSTGSMLKQVMLPASAGTVVTKSFPGYLVDRAGRYMATGSGLFQVLAAPPPAGDIIEIRVLNPYSSKMSVYALGIGNARSK